jgi:uncharacterized protein YjbI with pentapeptide repeats
MASFVCMFGPGFGWATSALGFSGKLCSWLLALPGNYNPAIEEPMNRRVQRRLAAVGAFLALLAPSRAAQNQKEWTWKDGERKTRTRAELDEILQQHDAWVKSSYSRGTGADLSHADLTGADLIDASLSGADLIGAKLSGADLSSANLLFADLTAANLTDADLSGANLNGADLSSAILSHVGLIRAGLIGTGLNRTYLKGADLTRADLAYADLTGADLSDADLTGATLSLADLSGTFMKGAILVQADLTRARMAGANLYDTDLSGANLFLANLTGAKFVNSELRDAGFSNVDLEGATFEPKSNPETRIIATANHLELMTYLSNPNALVQLRKQFQENGFRTQERRITCALSRRKAELDGPIERWFQTVAFDWTCQYGLNPGRALQIWLALSLFCWLVYAVFIHLPSGSGIYRLQKTGGPTAKKEIEEQIRPRKISSRPLWRYPFRLIHQAFRMLFWAGFFSLMSAFNIGFRDINFGRWLRLLPRTEYDLRAKGWARTVAGFQSLFSVYLIALWVLTYFGRPFE